MNVQSYVLLIIIAMAVFGVIIKIYRKHRKHEGRCTHCDSATCFFRNQKFQGKKK